MSHRTKLPLPPEQISDDSIELYEYLNRLVYVIETSLAHIGASIRSGWQPQNVPTTGNRNIDANLATLDQTRKGLARLIQDMKDGGILES